MLNRNMEGAENIDLSRQVATSADNEQYTVSVSEAAELFTAAGLPRTERAIQRFCKRGDLLSAFVDTPFGSKYLIRRSSIERLIQQKLQAQNFSADGDGRDLSRPDATVRDKSRQEPEPTPSNDAPRPAEIGNADKPVSQIESRDTGERQAATLDPELAGRVKKLEEENLNLKIDNKAKEQFINYLVTERKQMSDSMQDMSYRLGAAETRVQQLEAPKEPRQGSDTGDDMPRQVATDVPETEPIAEPVVEPNPTAQPEPVAVPAPQPEQKRGWFRW